tara:strand:+ start:575 stop:2059 length:1485 start_codon:yes stop_codon:yes gene_type:complete
MYFKNYEIWFVAGTQNLYGDSALVEIESNSAAISKSLNSNKSIITNIISKGIVKTSQEVKNLFIEANLNSNCIGIICWMHTFSPSRMWIDGLKALSKPLLHLHTQYNKHIPWDSIDMNYMNVHQSAHGDREFGYITSRMNIPRKIVVGHFKDKSSIDKISKWNRAAIGTMEMNKMKIARFGDNMRDVAVTEGDKIDAQIKFNIDVNGFGISELSKQLNTFTDKQINILLEDYYENYNVDDELMYNGNRHQDLKDAAGIELALRNFLIDGGYTGFTDTFEDLGSLKQLPGISVQRLMNEGYGFGAEGDWKVASLVRIIKSMTYDLNGGTSFMEDYTYHLNSDESLVLGSHMLEVCPSISDGNLSCEVHPLGIGGKNDPVRLVFNSKKGPALNISMIDLGRRFRLIVSKVESVQINETLPLLPVARALWKPLPNLDIAAHAWILSGGSHHTCFTFDLEIDHIIDFAEMNNIELIIIDEKTNILDIKNQLKWNNLSY